MLSIKKFLLGDSFWKVVRISAVFIALNIGAIIATLVYINNPTLLGVEAVPQRDLKEFTSDLSGEFPKATPVPGVNLALSASPRPENTSEEKPFMGSLDLPILMYHHVKKSPVDTSSGLTVTADTFEKQMKYLFEHNYKPITFKELEGYLSTEQEIPPKSVIITFDDGWEEQYENAFPVLKEYNFQATFFLVTNFLGAPSYMSSEEVREMQEYGMEIGSHTVNHPNLKGLSPSFLEYEIKNSKEVLEEKFGQSINVFAYPYGIYNSQITNVVKESDYYFARTTINKAQQDPEQPYYLGGIQIYNNLHQFENNFD